MLDTSEFERWIRSAKKTLESARVEIKIGADTYNWVCFKAHQSAEKALKALLWGIGKPVIGYMLPRLLDRVIEELGVEVPEDVRDAIMTLNKYYIPTRYPDVWSEGFPEEYFTRKDAVQAVRYAERIIDWVEELWRRLLKKGRVSGDRH